MRPFEEYGGDTHERLHYGVARAAERNAEARAIVSEDEDLTYGELATTARRLATVLRRHGCRVGDRVAVLSPHTPRAISALVGALHAGCAYVPLDATGAVDRTADMLQQCEPRVLLIDGCPTEILERLRARAPLDGVALGWIGDGEAPIDVDFDFADVCAAPEASEVEIGPDALAYILFTSGTTGSPKGVPITHASACAFIRWAVDYFELGPEDRLSGHTALTFDLSMFDMFATFAAGAELHLVPKRVKMLPHEVAGFIRERALTLWFSVPSQLTYVARFDALEGVTLPSLRHVVWCGDVLPTPSLLYWKEALPEAVFTNLYGPTETTVASSYFRVPETFDDPLADIPIGVGCDGEELLILDEDMRPVAEGEVGDIYIRGVGLSPGYWRDPERTADAFLPNPFASDGSRVYRTGDRGRFGPDGVVRFLGRADFQIKTAGYRVEPAEVEHALLRLPEVSACAVVPVTVDDFAGTEIGCVYVAAGAEPLSPAVTKRRLKDLLPSYMVPTRWMSLDELPLDSRGKIDRGRARALLEGRESPARLAGAAAPDS